MPKFAPISVWGVGAAVIAAWVLAAVWYSPLLFIRSWGTLSGVDGAKFNAGLPRAIAVDLVTFLIMSLMLDQVLQAWGALTIVSAMLCTTLLWLGFVAVALIHSVTYEQRCSALLRDQRRLSTGQYAGDGRDPDGLEITTWKER